MNKTLKEIMEVMTENEICSVIEEYFKIILDAGFTNDRDLEICEKFGIVIDDD